MKNIIVRGILAGIFIGIGCLAYLSIGGIIGAILFAFGLTSVVLTQSKLFTGMAGFWKSYKDILILIPVILLNFIGCFIVGMCVDGVDASQIVNARLTASLSHIFIYSIGTGIIMSTAVKYAKELNNFIPLLLGVPLFILCGMPHCIADICYYSIEGWKISYVLPWLTSIIGNFIGCNYIKLLNYKTILTL